MQLNAIHDEIAPLPSASIVLLRDAAAGLEVFLLKRHGLSDVLGGAYVFAGGKVDAADAEIDPRQHLDQPPDELVRQLAEAGLDEPTATGLFVAAVRELFEESGVLLAVGASADLAGALAQELRAGYQFDELLPMMRLRLATRELVPWSRWITPKIHKVSRKRFDTRFFLCRLPEGQQPRHDERETTDSAWVSPRQALAAYWNGEVEFAPPQIMSLAHLARHASVEEALRAARAVRPHLVEPESFEEAGERVLCYPGDPRHTVSLRAMPGPTRLAHRGGRFEPDGGFEGFFDDRA